MSSSLPPPKGSPPFSSPQQVNYDTTTTASTFTDTSYSEYSSTLQGTSLPAPIDNLSPAPSPPPTDKYKLVHMIIILHGIGTLIPWNMFIFAKDFYEVHKLGHASQWHRSQFYPLIQSGCQYPAVIFTWINVFCPCKGNLNRRITIALSVELMVCVFTLVLAISDSATWTEPFFWMTFFSVVVMNIAGGVYQNTVFGIASKLDYTAALVLGANLSGVFTALTSIIIYSTGASPLIAAMFYFGVATLIIFLCLISYVALHKFPYYHHRSSSSPDQLKSKASSIQKIISEAAQVPQEEQGFPSPPSVTPLPHGPCHLYWKVLQQCWVQCFNVFFVFFVTLSVFPGVLANVRRNGKDFVIEDPRYFMEITCFFTFSLFAFLGNLMADFVEWPKPKWLWVPVVLRALFIPLALVCNYNPTGWTRNNFTVICNDWAYWAIVAMLGLTSGYFSSLAMMFCPRAVKDVEDAPLAAMFGGAFLVTGVFIGVNFAATMPYLIGATPM